MMPDLEQMILDLEGRGWTVDMLKFTPDGKYELFLGNPHPMGEISSKFQTIGYSIKVVFEEAWRRCK